MRNGTPLIHAVGRTLDLLEQVVADRGRHGVTHLANASEVPLATAHRQIRTLVEYGYLVPIAKGRHTAGPRLLRLGTMIDPLATLTHAARPALHRLAASMRGTAHLGVLEQDMVTYLVKEGPTGDRLFTEEGKQLEAYCSGIGKVLLAHLTPDDRERYLADGPFTALTERTITDPAALRSELANIRERGFAVDDEEVASSVQCVAVPLFWGDGAPRAALSITRIGAPGSAAAIARRVAALHAVSAKLSVLLFADWGKDVPV